MKVFFILYLILYTQTPQAKIPEDFFFFSYEESRTEFIRLAKEISIGNHLEFRTPSSIDTDLTTDIFYYKNPKANKLLILTSGIHGTEAGVGSSALIYFLKKYFKTYQKRNLSILLIHSLNPYGHKYHRRVTENNIDLNRNLVLNSKIFNKKNIAYDKLDDILNPDEVVSGINLYNTFFHFIKKLIFGFKTKDIRQAIAGGQYHNQSGISFGGSTLEPISKKLIKLLSPIVSQHKKIFHLDFHTGLGEKGILHYITGSKLSLEAQNMAKQIFAPKSDQYNLTLPSDEGFYHTTGDIISFMTELSTHSKILSVAAEFGTMGMGLLPQIKTINSLIRDNQGHFYGYKNKKIKKEIKNNLNKVFYPRDTQWQKKVYKNINHLFTQILDKFISLR